MNLRCATLSLSLVLAGCSGCQKGSSEQLAGPAVSAAPSGTTEPPDAGQPPDASASKDGGKDAGHDGSKDATAEASAPPVWPGWTFMPGTEACPLYKPDDLAQAVAPATWSACASADGCVVLDLPWWDKVHASMPRAKFEKHGSTERLYALEQIGLNRYIPVVFALEQGGKPLFAWGAPLTCVSAVSLFHDNVAVAYGHGDSVGETLFVDYFIGPAEKLQDAPKTFTASSKDKPFYGGHQEQQLGDGIFAWWGPTIGVMDLATKAISLVDTGAPQYLADPRAVGKDVFFINRLSSGYTVWVRRPDGSVGKVISAASAHVPWFSSDGVDMVWVQASDPLPDDPTRFATWQLWTAPYTTDPAKLKPRKVAPLPFLSGIPLASPSLLSKGGMAIVQWGATNRVYRLSDGSYLEPPGSPEPGLHYEEALYLDQDELVIVITNGQRITVGRLKLSAMTLHPPEGP